MIEDIAANDGLGARFLRSAAAVVTIDRFTWRSQVDAIPANSVERKNAIKKSPARRLPAPRAASTRF